MEISGSFFLFGAHFRDTKVKILENNQLRFFVVTPLNRVFSQTLDISEESYRKKTSVKCDLLRF